MQNIGITGPSDVAAARRAASVAARAAGFGTVDEGRVALVATELAGNLVRHGGGGELLVHRTDGAVPGIELLALDRGPGMADVSACLRDGFSTAGTPGTGLGAIRRQSEEFDIHSAPGQGTAVLARLRRSRAAAPAAMFTCGAVKLPVAGEEVCGDDWGFALGAEAAALFVADGLGHGPLAAAASGEAVRLFRRAPFDPPAAVLQAVHAGLRPTRGAAVAIARLDLAGRDIVYGGIGNIASAVFGDIAGAVWGQGPGGHEMRRMVSMTGTAGHLAPRIREFHYPIAGAFLLIMCSDGLLTGWSVDRYAGIATRDPLLIAGLLYRDFVRGRDDVTVAVMKGVLP